MSNRIESATQRYLTEGSNNYLHPALIQDFIADYSKGWSMTKSYSLFLHF